MERHIPCVLMRGGTSKGVFLRREDLPEDPALRDKLLLRLMGSPDPRQIDGLGGATSVTSKVAILEKSNRADADVDYTFAQVSVDKAVVDTKGNCGNISSAVGPYAVATGMVEGKDPVTEVRVYNTNTQKVIVETFATPGGKVCYDGDYVIAGVPGSAAPVKLTFMDPAGAVFGRLLPTGNVTDELDIPHWGKVSVSIVDAANPLVFVKASDIGLTGRELPQSLEQAPQLLERLETVRGMAAQLLGLTEDYKKSAWETPAVPKMTFVAPPANYVTAAGKLIEAGEIDLVARMMSMQKPHQTYAMTGAMCTACAAAIPGTVVAQCLPPQASHNKLRIGHLGGIIEAGVEYTMSEGEINIISATGYRTARMLMSGTAFI